MEEKKIVNMEGKDVTTSSNQQKLSYDDLNTACAEMAQQLQNQDAYIGKIKQEAQRMTFALQSKKFDYMLTIIDFANKAVKQGCKYNFNEHFVQYCISEIEKDLTPSVEATQENIKEEV